MNLILFIYGNGMLGGIFQFLAKGEKRYSCLHFLNYSFRLLGFCLVSSASFPSPLNRNFFGCRVSSANEKVLITQL
jgi:hypothetical protein